MSFRAILRSFVFFSKKHLLDSFPTKASVVTEVLSVLANLIIYWYTAQAFGRAFASQGAGDYFNYVVIGEAVMTLPVIVFNGIPRIIQAACADGTFEIFLLSSRSQLAPFIIGCLSLVPRELIRIAFLLLTAFLVFHLNFHVLGFLVVIVLVLLVLPAILGMGFLSGAFLILMGRGTSLISQVGAILAILSGIYFPLSVFPDGLKHVVSILPFTIVMETSRAALAGMPISWLKVLGPLMAWGVLLGVAGARAFSYALRRLARRGDPLIF